MHLGRINYYADFVIYPALVFAFAITMLRQGGATHRLQWLFATAAGIILWTFVEYLLHRVVLHHIKVFAEMHALHHHEPLDKIGTPSWVSLPILLLAIFGPSCLIFGTFVGSGVTAGMMVGWIWYISVHHAIHHWQLDHEGYLYGMKRRHARHHYSHEGGNYGVTTSIWDHLLGSALPDGRPQGPGWLRRFSS